jgi:hypothetical protein
MSSCATTVTAAGASVMRSATREADVTVIVSAMLMRQSTALSRRLV